MTIYPQFSPLSCRRLCQQEIALFMNRIAWNHIHTRSIFEESIFRWLRFSYVIAVITFLCRHHRDNHTLSPSVLALCRRRSFNRSAMGNFVKGVQYNFRLWFRLKELSRVTDWLVPVEVLSFPYDVKSGTYLQTVIGFLSAQLYTFFCENWKRSSRNNLWITIMWFRADQRINPSKLHTQLQ